MEKIKNHRLKKLTGAFTRFFEMEASGGIILMFFTIFALAWANSAWAEEYFELWATYLSVGFGDWQLSKPLILWINDGLMAIFFFVVGLEIKREVIAGELATPAQAVLPIAAAIGGMVIPAGIFLLLNSGQPGAEGWGIPMATDIAFSLGILKLLGKRVPLTMKVFLTAFAIVDDIGAVIVIALFYSGEIYLTALVYAAVLLVVAVVFNIINIRWLGLYLLVGILMWYFLLKSGLHPTLAGVLMAFTIPAGRKINLKEYLQELQSSTAVLAGMSSLDAKRIPSPPEQAALYALNEHTDEAQSPLQKLEHRMHGMVVYLIMPIFALANAGVSVAGGVAEAATSGVAISIAAGLFIGKTLGVTLSAWLCIKAGLTTLPPNFGWKHVAGLGMLGGVGFTMALFIANLAFPADPVVLDNAKIGILMGSIVSGVTGYLLLNYSLKEKVEEGE